MSDSGALRQRRYELHKKGNHVLCNANRCKEAPTANPRGPAVAGVFSAAMGAESVEDAVTKFLETLRFDEGDPRVVSAACALRLAQLLDEKGPSPVHAASELRGIIEWLGTYGDDEKPTVIDTLRARRHAGRTEMFVNLAGKVADDTG